MIKPNCPTPHSSPASPLSSPAGESANRADVGSNCFVLYSTVRAAERFEVEEMSRTASFPPHSISKQIKNTGNFPPDKGEKRPALDFPRGFHYCVTARSAFTHAVKQARGGSHLGSRRETRLPQHRPDHHVPRWETHTVLRRKQHSTEPRPA